MIPISRVTSSPASAVFSENSTTPQSTKPDLFSSLFQSIQKQNNTLDSKATDTVAGLLNGHGVEIHDVMIATQKASLAFELALQVRNKAVAAYQQMSGMQF